MKTQFDYTTYPSHYRYKIQFVVGLLLSAAFGWSLLQRPAADTAFFTLTILSVTLWSGWDISSYVRLDPQSISLHRGFGTEVIALRQINAVSQEGRFGQSITLLYYPLLTTGLLDLDTIHSLILPQLQNQAELYDKLKAAIPV